MRMSKQRNSQHRKHRNYTEDTEDTEDTEEGQKKYRKRNVVFLIYFQSSHSATNEAEIFSVFSV